jgi:hypothetical protein
VHHADQSWAGTPAVVAALASYAKQAGDVLMERYMQRIKARAVQRTGQIAKEIEPASGGDHKSKGRAPAPLIGRKALGRAAGVSPHQLKQAVRVANVLSADFERQVESEKLPTITAMARRIKGVSGESLLHSLQDGTDHLQCSINLAPKALHHNWTAAHLTPGDIHLSY